MKKKTIFLYVFSALMYSPNFAQNCDKLIEGGLYSFTQMTNTGSFSKDLRTYYLSNQFKEDIRNGKWGGSVTIPIEGVPVTLGMDYSDEQYNAFRQKILSVTEIKISSDFYQTSISSIPNTNLYTAYVECERIKNDASKTGFVQGINIETENTVVFVIYYRPHSPGEAMPKVLSFSVQPAGSVISGAPTVGQRLSAFSVLVTAKKSEEQDMVLSLVTDKGSLASKSIAEGSISTTKEFPIGTIITSFLRLDQFNLATKNNEKSPGGIWTSQKSRWSPCDGRPLPGSKYGKIASQTNAPDLRGLFLRGLNSFDEGYTIPPREPNQISPNPKALGVYQPDELKSHLHTVSIGGTGGGVPGDQGWALENITRTGTISFSTNSTVPAGEETRPKNLAVYYYIKIN